MSRPRISIPATEQEVLDSLRRLALGRTVILASHSSAAHGFAGRRLDIRDGRAVPGARARHDATCCASSACGAAAPLWLAAGLVRVARRARCRGRDDGARRRDAGRGACRRRAGGTGGAALARAARGSCCATPNGW